MGTSQLQTISLLLATVAANLLPSSFRYAAVYKFHVFFFLTMARYETRATLDHFACLFKSKSDPGIFKFRDTYPTLQTQLMHRSSSYSTEIIGFGQGSSRRGHVALGFASCYMTLSNFPSLNNFEFHRVLAMVH